jgi:lipase maturation factor 1
VPVETRNPLDPHPLGLPVLTYDEESKVCRAAIDRWRLACGQVISFAPFERVKEQFPAIAGKIGQDSVYLVDKDERIYRGAEALMRTAAHCGRKRWLLRLYLRLPLFAPVATGMYQLAAVSRGPLTIVRRIWYGRDLKLPTYHISSALFLRLLGLVYLIAFISLWTQIDGLIGDHGILPEANFLDAAQQFFAQQNPPQSALWNLPTLAWINPHSGFLNFLCGSGALLSVLLMLGILPLPALILLWVDYLSLFHAGQVFLGFQWDILLLETGFVGIFLGPFTVRSRFLSDRHPPRLAIWLLWWLLFRLMFESGIVKLTWNAWLKGPDGAPVSNTWSSLTALDFHYWTQPLPIWTSWYAAQLPQWFQKMSVVFVFIVELGLPWLIFGPRLLRYIAFGGITLLMLLIAGTGNYNFFNLLTILLVLALLDDRVWPRFLQRRIRGTDWPALASPTRWRSLVLVPFAGLAVLLGTLQLKEAVSPREQPQPSLESRLNIAQFCLVNHYGLFRQMTETRPEILIEGSVDAIEWKSYEFRWKPGDLSRAPGFNSPHQPRLDWQMWFEALRLEQVHHATGNIDPRLASPWFQSFLLKLLKGEPAVVGLLAKNPFSDAPPKLIRISLYQYHFTDAAERQRTGHWWRRDPVCTGPGLSAAR